MTLAAAEISALVTRLAGRRILVVGDLCLDEYLVGTATRLSREAPVPVLEWRERRVLPGAAANPAHNIVALGSQAVACGVTGDDASGEALRAELQRLGIGIEGMVVDATRPTTTKTRIVAQGAQRFPQHLARIDRLDQRPFSNALIAHLCQRIAQLAPDVDAILVSDYRGGVAHDDVIAAIQDAARVYGLLTAVDSQGELVRYRGFGLVRCNALEAAAQVGWPLETDADSERAVVRLQKELVAQRLVVTRGGAGVTILERGDVAHHLPALNREEVYDVTGAGDTVSAVLVLALCAGIDLRTAAHLAMAAAGLVVRRLGNAVVTPAELVDALAGP